MSDEILKFVYTNYRNEISTRTVKPMGIHFGSNKWHKEEQWYLVGWDYERNAERFFAINDIVGLNAGLQLTKESKRSKLKSFIILAIVTFIIGAIINQISKNERCKPIHIKGDEYRVQQGCPLPPGYITDDPTQFSNWPEGK
jgi:hypothetical protein